MADRRWASRGGGHLLHAVTADLGRGRVAFACGREGWPCEPIGKGETCPACRSRIRRAVEAQAIDPRRARAAAAAV